MIPAAELEELQVIAGPELPSGGAARSVAAVFALGGHIVARSDRATLTLGCGLSRAELDWMRAVIWNVVTA